MPPLRARPDRTRPTPRWVRRVLLSLLLAIVIVAGAVVGFALLVSRAGAQTEDAPVVALKGTFEGLGTAQGMRIVIEDAGRTPSGRFTDSNGLEADIGGGWKAGGLEAVLAFPQRAVFVRLTPVSLGLQMTVLPIDGDVRRRLSDLGGTISGGRPIPEDQIHLTLRFIGEVDAGLFHDVRERLHRLKSHPLQLMVTGTGHFPPRGTPRVVWAGIQPAGEVIILRNRVNTILSGCGIAPEQRKFHPHITIARLKSSSPKRVADFLAGNALLQSPEFAVDRVHLYSSRLTTDGAIHRIEGSYPLDADRSP